MGVRNAFCLSWLRRCVFEELRSGRFKSNRQHLPAAFGADGIPETVVVGRNGIVRNVFIGAGHEEEIAAAADAALATDK